MVRKTKGTRQNPIMSDNISRKMVAEVMAASRGKRMARPLQVQNKIRLMSYDTASLEKKGRLTGCHEVQQDREEMLISR